MNILIKGMRMPSFGNETIIRIQSGGGILDQYGHHLDCEAIPAADVRPVVLCKDCKWWRGEETICKGIGIDFDADGFCCEGERKDSMETR